MGRRPTHRNESHALVTPAQAGVRVRRTNWIPAPRLRGDKLRGNNVTFDGVLMGLWPTRAHENRRRRHPRDSGRRGTPWRAPTPSGENDFHESEGGNLPRRQKPYEVFRRRALFGMTSSRVLRHTRRDRNRLWPTTDCPGLRLGLKKAGASGGV